VFAQFIVGLAKEGCVICALANLFMAREHLLRCYGEICRIDHRLLQIPQTPHQERHRHPILSLATEISVTVFQPPLLVQTFLRA